MTRFPLTVALAMGLALPALAQHAGHDSQTGAQNPAAAAYAEINARMHAAMAVPMTGDADRDFVIGMIPHHQGAVGVTGQRHRHRGVHGGWYGTILDSALGCAVATTLEPGAGYTTLEYKVNLTRGLKPGTLVECRARVQHAGRSTAVAEGTIIGVEDGKLYATGSTTCIILRG